MADITETVPFNFDELYAGLQTKFEDAGYDIEEGSNTSQLITAMAYLTSMLNVNTSVNINETLLPLATKRNNALQDARVLGYEIAHKQSYKYRLNIKLGEGDHTIPKYTEFTAGGKTYYYMGKQLEYKDVAAEGYNIEIDVKEGELHKYSDNTDILSITTGTTEDGDGNTIPQYYIDIPYVDVEDAGLEVFLTYYDDKGILNNREQWYQTSQFTTDGDFILDKEFIRIDDIDYKTPRIYFKYGGVGQGIRIGSIVEINVLTSSGTEGGIADITDPGALSHSLENFVIEGISIVLEGTDEESLESIKANAPKFWNSANRAVTKEDYEAICNRHSAVKTSQIWGGDDEFPKCPGHIWFSFLPSTYDRSYTQDKYNTLYSLNNPEDVTNWFIEVEEIRSTEYSDDGVLYNPGVWDELDNYKIPSLEFHNRHPIYLDFEYNIEVMKYSIKTSKADIHQGIFDVINNYFLGINEEKPLESFDIEYFHSNIEKRIDLDISDITGFNNNVTTKLMITGENISRENEESYYQDLFLQLAVPYKDYFDGNGYLLSDVLPSIDTENFAEITSGNTISQLDIWTDFSELTEPQESKAVITAPIRGSMVKEETLTEDITTTWEPESIIIGADDPTAIEADYTFNKSSIYVNDVLLDPSEYTISVMDGVFDVSFTNNPVSGDVIKVETNNVIGLYQLFNTYKKFIVIQFFVNAISSTSGDDDDTTTSDLFAGPRSYLTTADAFYDYTSDEYYLTTEGFAISNQSSNTAITGAVVRKLTPAYYLFSSLEREIFDTVRYLNLNYSSPNFKLMNNVMPRLKTVTFS